MIDIHSHILPGVDDGVQTLEDGLAMLRIAAAGGVTTQVLTPHLHPGRFDNTLEFLQQRFESFSEAVENAGIDIELRLAAEVHIGPEIMAMVTNDTLPWLGEYRGMKTFLLEFPLTSTPAGSINLVHWLIKHDVLPVIVHPERCREWQDHPERLAPYFEAGCPLQITGASLLGQFGTSAKTLAVEILESATEFVIATDCHNLAYRPPDLSQALGAASNIIGPTLARKATSDQPRALLGS